MADDTLNLEDVLLPNTMDTDEDYDYSELIEQLELYRNHPLNINTATYEDLDKLGIFNDLQITALLQYRKEYGSLNTVQELYFVHGFDASFIQTISPYIVFAEPPQKPLSLRLIRQQGKSDYMQRYSRALVAKQGFQPTENPTANRYLGSPDLLMLRYRFDVANRLRIGISAKKDPGENFFKSNQKQGFPFYSGYLALGQPTPHIKQLIVGNYQLQFGQGLCLWQGFTSGKSLDGVNFKRKAQTLKPYGSSTEYGYSQGGAILWQMGSFELAQFVSWKPLDGTVETCDSLGHPTVISSIVETGYHRTTNELSKKHTALQSLYGMHLDFKQSTFRLGATVHYNRLNVDYMPTIKPYNQFSIPPKSGVYAGFDFDGIWRSLRYYGEITMDNNRATAYQLGSKWILTPTTMLNIDYRNYSMYYKNFFANAISENSSVNNEKALSIGLLCEFSQAWSSTIFSDFFQFPWLSYSADAPLYGFEHRLRIHFKPNRRFNTYLQYQYKSKAINTTDDPFLHSIGQSHKHTARLHLEHTLSDYITIKQRLSMVYSNRSTGFLLYQDVQYRFAQTPLSVSFRYAVFNTDDYDSRIYAFESDVLYAYSSSAYYYKGSRFYVMLQYKCSRKLTLWLKYANTNITDRLSIGSGLDEIQGHDKPEIKLQLRWKF
ncbi:hypothetical protein FACS1894201_08300 [Bacteroidia bacterium]|nr:hypothetical protein FACS1894201_08300 [Bacteroidia bacterium]